MVLLTKNCHDIKALLVTPNLESCICYKFYILNWSLYFVCFYSIVFNISTGIYLFIFRIYLLTVSSKYLFASKDTTLMFTNTNACYSFNLVEQNVNMPGRYDVSFEKP